MEIAIVILVIILAILFNFVNGLNDAANSIATIVATRALSPLQSVLLASVFNLIGPFVFTTAIAATIGRGIVNPALISPSLLLAAIFGGVLWVFSASYFGIPVSSSHGLIGGLLGAGIAVGGFEAILWPPIEVLETVLLSMLVGGAVVAFLYTSLKFLKGDEWKSTVGVSFLAGMSISVPLLIILGFLRVTGILAVVIFIVISPMLGLLAAFFFGLVIMSLLRNHSPSDLGNVFKRLQIVAASFQSLGHGANDAQNAMGIITAMLIAGGFLSEFIVPIWVILTCTLAISLGTLLGGWRVVEKMAQKITKIRPYQGFAASTAGGVVLSLMTAFGVPVSTTHAMAGSIMGVGATRGYSAVKWGIVREIVAAWIITIPASALVSWLFFSGYSFFFP
jgi:PiT family inorganic phosphate transporter